MKSMTIRTSLMTLFICGGLVAASGAQPIEPDTQSTEPTEWPLLHYGVDDGTSTNELEKEPWAADAFRELGVDLYVCHARPYKQVAQYVESARSVDAWCRENGFRFIWNLELANWWREFVDDQGRDWFNHPDGRHFELLPEDVLAELSKCKSLQGVMYDEAAHMQNCRNMVPNDNVPWRPWVYDPAGDELADGSARFTEAVRKLAQIYARHDIPLYTEHVIPALFHAFARAGYTAGPKYLKEGWAPVVTAMAMGAAIQYNTELWITPDLWGMNAGEYPGHSVEEYRSALLLAYHMGADVIYTENLAYTDPATNYGSLIRLTEDGYELTDHGKVTASFRKEYVPAHPRRYTFRQLKPRVAIIREPDSCWGQSKSWMGNRLFGNDDWPGTPATEAWVGIWNVLTRGQVAEDSLNWHGGGSYIGRPHQFFCPLDGVVVFDQYAKANHIAGVELIFLTGLSVSGETLRAIEARVAEGALCITLPSLAPGRVREATGGAGALTDGQGRWLLTDSFTTPEVRNAVEPFLPPEDTIRYRFGDTEVTFKTIDGDTDRLSVDVRQVTQNP